MRTILYKSALALAFALGAACTATTSDATRAQAASGDSPESISVDVEPDTVQLYTHQSRLFVAAVNGVQNQRVNWSVTGGDANGTITAAGSYTAPGRTGDFQVVAASQAAPLVMGTAAVSVIQAPPDGTPMTTAHRTSGVAPLAVFFDAINDVAVASSVNGATFAWSSSVFQPTDYEGTLYSWNFGDPGSGTWAVTGNSKNVATGYTAAHVYETPGTYTATLTITDASGTARTYSQTINVSAFSGTTYYVSNAGSDSNNGLGPDTPFASVRYAMTTALARSGPVRILFRRGDTFTVSAAYSIRKAGPGIIGAYGSGNRPILTCPDLGVTSIFSASGTGTDWRIMDLDLVGPSTSSNTGPIGPPVTAQGVNTLYLRLRARNWKVGLGWGEWTPIFATPHDGQFVVDCEVPGAGTYCGYFGGRRLVIMGNNFQDGGNTHVLRVWQAHKAVISNNALMRPHAQRHCLKLHGPSVNGADAMNGQRLVCPATRWVTVSDNIIAPSTLSQWSISVGPQDSVNDERISHVVFERNRHVQSTRSLIADIEGSASHVMIRNNVFEGTNAASYSAILYRQRGLEPVPDDIRIYNNTFYKGGSNSSSGTAFLDLSTVPEAPNGYATNVRFRNNLCAFGSGSATLVLTGRGPGAGFVQDHNLLTTSPGFTNTGTDFSLTPTSPAANAGATLPEVREDVLRRARAVGTGYDIGAFESQ